MKIEDQVCTLEQAKKLKELRILQQSAFKYVGELADILDLVTTSGYEWEYHPGHGDRQIQLSAFTVAELGIMLNAKSNETKNCHYHNPSKMYSHLRAFNPSLFRTEAESRADYLIFLLENKVMTAHEVNKQLTE